MLSSADCTALHCTALHCTALHCTVPVAVAVAAGVQALPHAPAPNSADPPFSQILGSTECRAHHMQGSAQQSQRVVE